MQASKATAEYGVQLSRTAASGRQGLARSLPPSYFAQMIEHAVASTARDGRWEMDLDRTVRAWPQSQTAPGAVPAWACLAHPSPATWHHVGTMSQDPLILFWDIADCWRSLTVGWVSDV
ncbi:uncharacterized protein PG986_009778 [Apiospora aurea]|uniref:Uncharacterized protein n=1 Tax=Apiospora aurea TaxID=335848 RepID=A0ABR1Q8N7_9PEZI